MELQVCNRINTELQGDVVDRQPATPRPYQNQAIEECLKAYKTNDRATCVMACGTGKTLIGLWVAERLRCQKVLVLLPSLQLLRQTLYDWRRDTSWPRLSFRCVCSDPTVTHGTDQEDKLRLSLVDMEFPVNTKSDEVREFLARTGAGIRIVFSTYDSAKVVAEAMQPGERFDLGIFDEAHHTAGLEGKRAAFALEDNNLPIEKRLFLTATPRRSNNSIRNKDGDPTVSYSMDDPAQYGHTVHRLDFSEAAEEGIICRFKVVISVVTTEMVNQVLLNRGEVLVNMDPVRARQVANQIALLEATKQHAIHKIVTFHARVDSAQSFVSEGSEGVQTHLTDYITLHVNGEQRTQEREDILEEFKRADNALVSNARCMTEGVNVPNIDMVAFLSPKKSTVDIVQAVGRASRKDKNNPGKEAYVLVLLYLEVHAGESVGEAAKRADCGELLNVLSALKDVNHELADDVSTMRQQIGQGKGFDDSRFREKVEVLGPVVDLDTFRSAITILCIEKLSCTWDQRFGALLAYKEDHGHCNVPHRFVTDDGQKLGSWVHTQRKAYSKDPKQFGAERIRKLEEIGFELDPHEAIWQQKYAALLAYQERYGDCNVPQRFVTDDGLNLGAWVGIQRKAYNEDPKKISDERTRKLEEIGFVWDQPEAAWQQMYVTLLAYKVEHGDCNVPAKFVTDDGLNLGAWVSGQRKAYSKDPKAISPERIRILDDIGFEWDPHEAIWQQKYAALLAYKEENGDCNVPYVFVTDNGLNLGTWANTQRKAYNKDPKEISDERIRKLEEIGFVWKLTWTHGEGRRRRLNHYRAGQIATA